MKIRFREKCGVMRAKTENTVHAPEQTPANTLNVFRNRAVWSNQKPLHRGSHASLCITQNQITLKEDTGFIDWLGPRLLEPNFFLIAGADLKRLVHYSFDDDDLVTTLAVHAWGD
jgi:hypothetical protein